MTSPNRDPIPRLLTHWDLDHTPDDGNRYEVIDGELYVSPFPTFAHQKAVSALLAILWRYVEERQLGMVLAPGLKVVLDEPTGVGPDVIYISTARLVDMREDGFHGAPDLLVEVVSSKPMLDRHLKFRKYESSGVANYWIIDPVQRRLEEYRLEGGRYAFGADLRADQKFELKLFPGLTIDLRDLWT